MKFPDSSFWNYSCQLFQIREVADGCLQLQNQFNADVNILLYCCWAGDNRIQLDNVDVQKLVKCSEPWQTAIIKPLRDARKMLKNQIIAMPAHLHAQTITNLSEMEINAEHMAQLNLEKIIYFENRKACDGTIISTSARNLLLYLQTLPGIQLGEISPQLTDLLKLIYDDAEQVQSAVMAAIT